MEKQSFTTSFLVDHTPEQVFDAVKDVRGWWAGEIEGRTDVVGAEFTYRFEDFHRTTQKVTELVPGKRIVWDVVDSMIGFVEDKTEWNGTRIVFEITKKGDKTELRFTHEGLVPQIECHDKCARAWTFYMNESLRNLIEKGVGKSPKDAR